MRRLHFEAPVGTTRRALENSFCIDAGGAKFERCVRDGFTRVRIEDDACERATSRSPRFHDGAPRRQHDITDTTGIGRPAPTQPEPANEDDDERSVNEPRQEWRATGGQLEREWRARQQMRARGDVACGRAAFGFLSVERDDGASLVDVGAAQKLVLFVA